MPDLSKFENITDEELAALNRARMLAKPVTVKPSPAFNGKKMVSIEGGGFGWKPIGVGHLRHDAEFFMTHGQSVLDQLESLGL